MQRFQIIFYFGSVQSDNNTFGMFKFQILTILLTVVSISSLCVAQMGRYRNTKISLDDDYLDSNGRAAEMISGHGNGRDTDADAELHAGKYTDDERELQSNAKRIRGRGVQYYGGKGGAASQFTGNYPYAHDRPDPYHRSQFHDTNRNRAIRGSRGFGLGFPFNLFGFGAFSSLFL